MRRSWGRSSRALAFQCALIFLLFGLFATVARADEAGEDVAHATQITSGAAINGKFDANGDQDWFVVYTNPQQALDVSVTKVGAGCSGDIGAYLLDRDGVRIGSDIAESDQTIHLTQTTGAEPSRFYIRLGPNSCAGDPYQLIVSPAQAIMASSPLQATQPVADPRALPEPNDTITAPGGPLEGGVTYGAQFEAKGDADYYVFYVNAQQPVNINITKIGDGCSDSVGATLLDTDGNNKGFAAPGDNETDGFSFTSGAAPERYYLRFGPNDCAGDPYQLRIDPGSSVTLTPPPPPSIAPPPITVTPTSTLLGEPNDTREQAIGPLAGGVTYSAQFETPNNADWYFFWAGSQKPLDITVSKVGRGCSGDVGFRLLDADGIEQDEVDPGSDESAHFKLTSPPGGASYYIQAGPNTCAGDPYTIRIDPAASVSSTAPGPDTRGKPTLKLESAKKNGASLTASGSKFVVLNIRGRLYRPRGVTTAACNGKVTLLVNNAKTPIFARRVTVNRKCQYAKAVRFARTLLKNKKEVSVRVIFAGNRQLRGFELKPFKLKLRQSK